MEARWQRYHSLFAPQDCHLGRAPSKPGPLAHSSHNYHRPPFPPPAPPSVLDIGGGPPPAP
eukprot:12922039-Prorocentrum_lima.AAC.1